MKKSNIILLGVISLMIAWSAVFQWMAAIAISDHAAGRLSSIAMNTRSAMIRSKLIWQQLPVFSSIEIRGKGLIGLTLVQGKDCSIQMDPILRGQMKSHMEYDKLVMELPGFSDTREGVYLITCPNLKMIILDNTTNTYIRNFKQPSLHLSVNNVYPLSIMHCTLNDFNLSSLDDLHSQYIALDSSNFINQLTLSIAGKGTLKLGTAGKLKTSIQLSDSIDIQASSRIMKQISLSGKQ
jgi:hypothetical protein